MPSVLMVVMGVGLSDGVESWACGYKVDALAVKVANQTNLQHPPQRVDNDNEPLNTAALLSRPVNDPFRHLFSSRHRRSD